MSILARAFRLLNSSERRKALVVLVFVLVVALAETIGTVSVMPFLAVLANPGLIESNWALATLHGRLGFGADPQPFLIFLGLASFALLVLSAVMRSLGQFMVIRFTQQRAFSIGRRLLEAYLRRPYAFYLSRHSGDMSQALLSEISMLVQQVYQPLTVLFAQGILLTTLVILLVVVNPVVAAIGIAVLGLCYGAVFLTIRRHLDHMARQRIAANRARFRLVAEALGGIKVVKLAGQEKNYLDRFGNAARRLARLQAITQTLAQVPRYAIEAVAFGGIIFLALVLMIQHRDDPNGGLSQVLPLLGVYAFAGYRLMPAIQAIYAAVTQLRAGAPILDSIAEDLNAAAVLPALPQHPAVPLPFRREVVLDRIGFRHEEVDRDALQDVSLTLPVGSSLGIVGSTGAGKTTLVDVFLGLLTPSSGQIRVDGVAVDAKSLRSWQANLGYVPQDIFLLDASVAENIAFGLPAKEIDHDRVRDCARMAQLLEFIERELPQAFDTMVGERGVRLSGGQRQRIGIARALYGNPEILVFDEATSALDNVTEKAVVEAIDRLSGMKTIVIIAHRISTIRDCDQILVLNHGKVLGLGSYEVLYDTNPAFRRLVAAADVR